MSEFTRVLAGRRILVVEDEYLIAVELKRWLEGAGAAVVGPVPSVEQALDLIDEDGLAAAVLDVSLGDGDTVYPVADKLAAAGIPYIFATGDVTVSGADGYRARPRLEKPYLETELLLAVAALLR